MKLKIPSSKHKICSISIFRANILFRFTINTVSSIYWQINVHAGNNSCSHSSHYPKWRGVHLPPIIKSNNSFSVWIRAQSSFRAFYRHGCQHWRRVLRPSMKSARHETKDCARYDRSCVKGHLFLQLTLMWSFTSCSPDSVNGSISLHFP